MSIGLYVYRLILISVSVEEETGYTNMPFNIFVGTSIKMSIVRSNAENTTNALWVSSEYIHADFLDVYVCFHMWCATASLDVPLYLAMYYTNSVNKDIQYRC